VAALTQGQAGDGCRVAAMGPRARVLPIHDGDRPQGAIEAGADLVNRTTARITCLPTRSTRAADLYGPRQLLVPHGHGGKPHGELARPDGAHRLRRAAAHHGRPPSSVRTTRLNEERAVRRWRAKSRRARRHGDAEAPRSRRHLDTKRRRAVAARTAGIGRAGDQQARSVRDRSLQPRIEGPAAAPSRPGKAHGISAELVALIASRGAGELLDVRVEAPARRPATMQVVVASRATAGRSTPRMEGPARARRGGERSVAETRRDRAGSTTSAVAENGSCIAPGSRPGVLERCLSAHARAASTTTARTASAPKAVRLAPHSAPSRGHGVRAR